MQSDIAPTAAGGSAVLHWAGRVTDEVFSFLGPASAALARAGLEQTVVLIDDPRYRHLLPRFDNSVSLILTPDLSNRYALWKRAHDLFVRALRDASPSAVHLHGFIPYMLGAGTVRVRAAGTQVYYSPHGSRSLNPSLGSNTLLRWASNSLVGDADAHNIANISTDARTLSATTRRPVSLVESTVAQPFFDVDRKEARHPLVVTGNRIPDFDGACVFAQLAVLMSEESWHLGFHWIGSSDAQSESCLRAADVGVFDITDDVERAHRLSAAWVFVSPTCKSGFPLFLAEAMAVGLPCVVFDTHYHRDLIEDGVTGYLCRDEEEMVERVAALVDSAPLRGAIGAAARCEASARFSGHSFSDTLRGSYGLAASRQQCEVR